MLLLKIKKTSITTFSYIVLTVLLSQILSCVAAVENYNRPTNCNKDFQQKYISHQASSWMSSENGRNKNFTSGISASKLQQNAVLANQKITKKRSQQTIANSNQNLFLQYDNKYSEWNTGPRKNNKVTIGENMPLHREHHIRAMKDLNKSDVMDINVGPEIIIKDNKQNDIGKNTKEPDSTLGIGVEFQYKF